MPSHFSLIRRRVALLAAGLAAGLTLVGCTSVSPGPKTVLVAGATGQTGRLIVAELLARGYEVRALVRDEAKARERLGDNVELVTGDIKDPAALPPAFSGIDAVISAVGAADAIGPNRPETVDYLGVRNMVDAALDSGVQHFLLMSSRSVTHPDDPLNEMFGNVLLWKLKGEDYLRASGLAYTVVRSGGLPAEVSGDWDIFFEQGDVYITRSSEIRRAITRSEVARVFVEALQYPEARYRTFEVAARPGPADEDWRAKFAVLEPDTK